MYELLFFVCATKILLDMSIFNTVLGIKTSRTKYCISTNEKKREEITKISNFLYNIFVKRKKKLC